MEEKTLTEIESKDYLLKISEDKIKELEKSLRRHNNFLLISIYTIFPMAILGLLSITRENVKFFLIMLPVALILIALSLGLLGWLVEKIKK